MPSPATANPGFEGRSLTRQLFDDGDFRATAVVSFGPFKLDIGRRLIIKGSSARPIADKLLRMLVVFLESRGAILSKTALAERIWPGQTVSLANVNQHLFMLRQLLGESARDHSFIITHPRKGYRFAVATIIVEHSSPIEESRAGWDSVTSRDASGEAFRLYCRGCHLLDRQERDSVERAVTTFEDAHDAERSADWALNGAARAYIFLGEQQFVASQAAHFKARAHIDAALRINPTSAVAHALRSQVLLLFTWDFEGARRELERAQLLSHGNPIVRHTASRFATTIGNVARGVTEAEHALSAQPSSLAFQLCLARALASASRFDDAIILFDELLETEPALSAAREGRARAYLLKGNAVSSIEDLMALSNDLTPVPNALLARAHAETGNHRLAADLYERIIAHSKNRYTSSFSVAIAAAACGQDDAAMRNLSRAFIEHDPALLQLTHQPGMRRWFEVLDTFPDFQKLLWALPKLQP